MKRRPTVGGVASRPIEFWPRRFFLLVAREPPRLSLRISTTSVSSPPRPLPLPFPSTPGVAFVEFETSLLMPRGRETRLDVSHTIRFCRFLNAARRRASTSPTRLHFVLRSQIRGDEAMVVELLVRWRLLSLELSPADALAPFAHLQSLFQRDFVSLEASLAGIAKGVVIGLLVSSRVFQDQEEEVEDGENENNETSACFTRITTRFLLFAGPVDDQLGLSDASDPERPPTADDKQAYSPVLSVAQLTPLLKQRGVSMVVKLNAVPHYDDQLIVRSGIDHLDLSDQRDEIRVSVVTRFLESCEHLHLPHSVVAVHSSTGRGRAAFAIACFLVKHHDFTADEAIGWLRFCCPQALVAVWMTRQLQRLEAPLRRDGDAFRQRRLMETTTSLRRQSLSREHEELVSLTSQISIGQIALGRDSLLGTKDRVRPSQVLPLPKRASADSGMFKELIASDAVLGAQHTRRPLTQGAAVGRRRQLADHHHHGGFATLHKFLHASGSSGSSGASGSSRDATRTAPDRTVDSTTPSRSRSRGFSSTPRTLD